MNIRPELGMENEGKSGDYPHLARPNRPIMKDRDNYRHWFLYGGNNLAGMSPERHAEIAAEMQADIDNPLVYDWESDIEIPKTPKQSADQIRNLKEWQEDKGLVERMNQPMAANISTDWKDDDGNYMPAAVFSKALLDDKTGGSFKNTLNNQSDGDRQEWLNNHHGGRGLGYMGQNKFHRQPSAYGPGTTYNMDERRANVQANARPALLRQLARMNRPQVPAYGAGLYQLGKMPWQ